ncbi:hypothetical protein ABBQ32_008751 [Trebouxia sp. C0010 RCD-2024]
MATVSTLHDNTVLSINIRRKNIAPAPATSSQCEKPPQLILTHKIDTMKAQYGHGGWAGTLAQGWAHSPSAPRLRQSRSEALLHSNKPIVVAHATKGSLTREAANHRKVKVAQSE